jgi:putative acetyltransferase
MIEIRPIQQNQIEQTKQVVITVCLEIWQDILTEEDLKHYDSMSDIKQVRSHYFDNKGLFLVLVDGDRVVGTGAIRKLNDEVCELKRMWFLKAYRGRGWGSKMAQMLFDFAKQTGYQKVRLDPANEERQSQALKLYKKLEYVKKIVSRERDQSEIRSPNSMTKRLSAGFQSRMGIVHFLAILWIKGRTLLPCVPLPTKDPQPCFASLKAKRDDDDQI